MAFSIRGLEIMKKGLVPTLPHLGYYFYNFCKQSLNEVFICKGGVINVLIEEVSESLVANHQVTHMKVIFKMLVLTTYCN
jgi:hypothetical protein